MYQSIYALNKADMITNQYVGVIDWHGTQATQYKVTLKNNGKKFTLDYHMGMAHQNEPKLSDVLYSLIMDSQAVEMSFSEWCSMLDYDENSMKDFKIYSQCKRLGKKFYSLFDNEEIENFKQLLEEY